MLASVDYDAIDLETVHANISGHAKRGYSGDLQYRMGRYPKPYIEMSRSEVHVGRNGQPPTMNSEILESIEDSWKAIDAWIQRPTRFLLVSLNHGIISRVLISDASHIK